MPKVPDNPQFRGPQSGGRGATNAAAQIGSALEGVGRVLTDASGEIDKRLIRFQQEKDNARLLDYEGQIATTERDFWNWTLKNQDPETWPTEWERTVGRTMDGITTQDGSPEFRRRRAMMVKAKRIAGMDKMRAQAGMLEVQNIKQTYKNTVRRHEFDGNHGLARQTLEQGREVLGDAYVSAETQRLDEAEVIYREETTPDDQLNDKISMMEEGGGPLKNEYTRRQVLDRLKRRRRTLAVEQTRNIREWVNAQPGAVTEGQIRERFGSTILTPEEQDMAIKAALSDKPLDTVNRGSMTRKLRELRTYYHSPNMFAEEYDERRMQLELEMNYIDPTGKRAPDLWGAFNRTDRMEMERATAEMWEKWDKAGAAERKEMVGYVTEHIAEPIALRKLGYSDDETREDFMAVTGMTAKQIDKKLDKWNADFTRWLETTELPKGKAQKEEAIKAQFEKWYAREFADFAIEDMDRGAFGGDVGDPSLAPVRPLDYGGVSQDANNRNAPLPLEGALPAANLIVPDMSVLPSKGAPITELD